MSCGYLMVVSADQTGLSYFTQGLSQQSSVLTRTHTYI